MSTLPVVSHHPAHYCQAGVDTWATQQPHTFTQHILLRNCGRIASLISILQHLLSGFANDNDSVWAEGELQKYDVVPSAATGGPLAIFWSDDFSCDCEERGGYSGGLW